MRLPPHFGGLGELVAVIHSVIQGVNAVVEAVEIELRHGCLLSLAVGDLSMPDPNTSSGATPFRR
jgi:hypothetical protein